MHDGDVDVGVVQLFPEDLGQAADRVLAGAVGALGGAAHDAEDAGDVDDVRVGGLHQRGQEEVAPVDHPPQVHPQHEVEVVQGVLVEGLVGGDAGVVDQQIDLAVGVQALLGERGHRLAVGHAEDVAAGPLELVGDRLQTLRVDIHQGQSRALGVKGVGQRLADAAGCSGDDRYLSVDAHVAPYRAWMQRS